jgi:hypothetical protein
VGEDRPPERGFRSLAGCIHGHAQTLGEESEQGAISRAQRFPEAALVQIDGLFFYQVHAQTDRRLPQNNTPSIVLPASPCIPGITWA